MIQNINSFIMIVEFWRIKCLKYFVALLDIYFFPTYFHMLFNTVIKMPLLDYLHILLVFMYRICIIYNLTH